MKKLFRASTLIISFILVITTVNSQNQNIVQVKTRDGKEISERIILNSDSNSQSYLSTKNGDLKNFSSNENELIYAQNNPETENDSILDIIIEFIEEPLFIKQKRNPHLKLSTFSTFSLEPFYKNRFREFEEKLENIQSLKSTAIQSQINNTYHKIFFGVNVKIPREMLEEIKKLPYVKKVHPNNKVELTLTESVPLIRADKVWTDVGSKGEGVKVAIIDTGIDYTHPAFGGNPESTFPTDKIVGGYDFVNYDSDPMDDHYHGTHCAGIVAADNEVIKGVAPKALLYAYKVFGQYGHSSENNIIAAIEKTVDPDNDGDYSDKLDIASLSFGGGGGGPDGAQSTAVDNASEMGVIFCISAGNGYRYRTISSPGSARKAITVGSASKQDVISNFSSKGPNHKINTIKPELLAPGSGIYSTTPTYLTYNMANNGYAANYESFSGTSMAAPHIAGVCALIKKLHPNWTPEQVKSALMTTAIDIGEDAMTQGAGRVDAYNATTVTSFAIPSKLDFGFNYGDQSIWTSTKTISVTNNNENTQEYTVTNSELLAGIKLESNPSSFALNSGETKEILITLTIDNNILGYPSKVSKAFDGTVFINGTIDNLHLPWAFLKSARLFVVFDSIPYLNHFIVTLFNSDKDYYGYSWDEPLYPTREPLPLPSTSFEMFIEPGIYDIVGRFNVSRKIYIDNVFSGVHRPQRIIIREQVTIGGNDTLSFNSSEAKNNVVFKGKKENGDLLDDPSNSFTKLSRIAKIFLPYHQNTWHDYIGCSSSMDTLFLSDFSDRFSLFSGEFLVEEEEKKIYVVNYDVIKGLNNSITLTNDPSELITQDINIGFNKSTEKPGILISRMFTYYDLFHGHYVSSGGGSVYNLDPNTYNWKGKLYMTPFKHPTHHLTTFIKAYNSSLLYKLPWFHLKEFKVSEGRIFSFNEKYTSTPTPDISFSPNNGKIEIGCGAIHIRTKFTNQSTKIRTCTNSYGQLKEQRGSDIYNNTFSIYDSQHNLVLSDSLRNTQSIVNTQSINVASSEKYNFEIINTNYFIENIQGKATLNSVFDLSKNDRNPPYLTSLQIRNSEGCPLQKLGKNENAEVRFSVRDHYSLATDSTKLYSKVMGTENWQEIELTKLLDNSEIGSYYSADISAFTNLEATYLDLKFVAQDNEGNSIEFVLEPAVAINSTPVIYSLKDTTIAKNSTAEIILKADNFDDDDLIFTSSSDKSTVDLVVNDTTLAISPEQDWVGTANIQVKVSDGLIADSTSFLFTAINTPPIISIITDTTIGKNCTAEIILKADDFDDDDLIFTSSSDNSTVSLLINDTTLTISPEQDWVGTANIQIKVSDGGLSDSTNFVLTIMSFTGIEDPSDQYNDYINIYPNPNNTGIFKLYSKLGGGNKHLKIDAYNLQGKLVYSENFDIHSESNETIVIDLSKLAKGVYILKINLDDIILNKKVIIQ